MPEMVDPMTGLVSLQAEHRAGNVDWILAQLYADVFYIVDEPGGVKRFTYALLGGARVDAIVQVCADYPVESVPCYQIGYAVAESRRGKGLAKSLIKKVIEELRVGLFNGLGISEFYVKAIISTENAASQRVAEQVLSDAPQSGTEGISGKPALIYLKRILHAPE